MSTFQISNEIPASLDNIWNIVSDIDREPEYWHGTKSVMNIRKVGNIVERETVIAFRNSVCKKILTLDAKNAIKKRLIDGHIRANKQNTSRCKLGYYSQWFFWTLRVDNKKAHIKRNSGRSK